MVRITGTIFLVLFLFLFLSDCDKPTKEDFILEILREVNEVRSTGCFCGEDSMPPVHALLWDDALDMAAQRHVRDMSLNNYLDHIGTDASTPYQRAAEAGFEGAFIGENIARGYLTIQDVMNQWIHSPSHCRTIMDDHYYYIAVAYDDYYWVQMFGSN